MSNQISKAHSIVGHSHGRPDDDFYPTPREATLALLDREVFRGIVWEPACGDGAISEVLKDIGIYVVSSDIVHRGYEDTFIHDFIRDRSCYSKGEVDHIITNPPYSMAQEFVEQALRNTTGKVAMLLKLQFLEGINRRPFFRTTPLKKVYVFSKRLQLTRNGEKMKNGGMICFAWFVWEHGYTGRPEIDWI